MGDGFMTVFESAGDAIACAVTMQRAVAEQELTLRVGISAGEVTAEDGDYFGVAVIEASRLCAAAEGGQVLVSDIVRVLAGVNRSHVLAAAGQLALKGLPRLLTTWQVEWDPGEDTALRVALADDSVLLRQGIASVLETEGMDVVLQAGDADSLLAALAATRPHVVVVDVRMPPTHTTEGLLAAERIRAEHPEIGVLVLSASVQVTAAQRLLRHSTHGVGYLLKERVGEISELVAAIRTIAGGGSAIDPAVVGGLAA
jgi:CheY-like chemotaxis protein